MLNETGVNQYSNSALPSGKSRVPKFLYAAVVILVVLILIVNEINANLREEKNKANKVTKRVLQNTPAMNLVNEKSVIDWLLTQKDNDGKYWANYICKTDPSFVCEEKQHSNYTGVPVMWGMSKYYLATKDEKILATLKNDLKTYADDQKVVVVGTYNLTCKLLTDMMSESFWNAEEKKSLQKICTKTDLIADRLTKYTWNNNDITQEKLTENIYQKLAYILSTGEKSKKFSDYTKIIKTEGPMDWYPYMSTELLEKYKLTYDKNYLKRSLFITDVVLENYINNQKKLLADSKCRLGRNLLDLSKVDHNPAFVGVSEKIFKENKTISAIDCAMLGSELYTATKKTEYKDYLKERLANDGGYKLMQNIDIKAFVFGETKESVDIDLDSNALLVGLLSIQQSQ